MSLGDPARDRSAARTYAVLAALACLGGSAVLCLIATVIVVGSTSHYGAAASGQVMLGLLSAEVLVCWLALAAYAVALIRRKLPWWGLWWGAAAIVMQLGLAMLGFVTLVMFNR